MTCFLSVLSRMVYIVEIDGLTFAAIVGSAGRALLAQILFDIERVVGIISMDFFCDNVSFQLFCNLVC